MFEGMLAKALSELNDTRAVDQLIQRLKDSNPMVQSNAARSLGRLKDTRALNPLIEAIRDKDTYSYEDVHQAQLWHWENSTIRERSSP